MTKLAIRSSEDPELHVFGYGVLRLSQIKAKVKEYIQEMSKRAAREDWRNVAWFAHRNGVLKACLETIERYEKEKGL